MRTKIAILLTGFILLPGLLIHIKGQHQHRHILDGEEQTIVCYYTDEVIDRYIPPPSAYNSRMKSGMEAGAKFNFIVENAPNRTDVLAACKMAGEIWGSIIYSPIPITVKIVFAEQSSGTLASTGTPWPPRLMDNNGYLPARYYVQALAEKFYRLNLNGDNPDMSMTYNNTVNWYLKTDGETPAGKYDFLSTLLHEMAHGLGFFGYFHVDDDGIGNGVPIPNVFDGFFEDKNGNRLADTIKFPQPSMKLGDALTTPPVYYNSPIVVKELPEETILPKMFIPNPWRGGNSLYHLDLIYDFKNAGRDALMTYATGTAEAIHDPGPITKYMLYEIGWVHTYIDVDTLKDRESTGEPFTVKAVIKGDMGIKSNTQKLYYSFNSFQSIQSVNMTPTGNPDEYKADIPVPGTGTTVNYYVQTEDNFDRVYTMPAEAPKYYYRFHVGPDNTPPTIEHSPIKFILLSNDTVEVKAIISDNLGLSETLVEYKINDVDQPSVSLEHDTLSEYIGDIVFSDGQIKAEDVIKYRIKAVDGAAAKHTTYDPATGYHEVKVEDLPAFVEVYYNNFDTEDDMFEFGLNGFSRQKPVGWDSYGLHTDHPYPAPNREGGYIYLDATLKIPVKLVSGTRMSFKEIVYIEEGEENSKYGDWNFWDYAIIEGSKDGGRNWYAFEDGWDCRIDQTWFDHFTGIVYQDYNNNLSLAVPAEYDRKYHIIDLLGSPYFKEGDEILIRFSLYSDPFFSGWGWSIEDLHIGPTASLDGYSDLSGAIDIYPNPSNGQVVVKIKLEQEVDKLDVGLYNMTGQKIFMESFDSPGREFNQFFNLDQLPNGIYLMKFSTGRQSIIKKVILAR